MILLTLWLACAGEELDSNAAYCAEAPSVSWDGFAHGFVTTYCTSCHSVNNTQHRYEAPEGVDFDTEADVVRQAERVRARVLDDATMPIGGGVYEADLVLLDTYLTCTLGL
ncbi:hypothetical protein LBMAG42_01890 [Deltaproteobacteria bacterium]|nr:hypothetical protein LBMAG42_01890 [Deltaproteobacteria bacterium]